MRLLIPVATALLAVAVVEPATAATSCQQEIRQAQRYFQANLRPGPNTDRAWRELRQARNSQTPRGCFDNLRQANYYAQRSLDADRRYARRYR
jgi:hypothetical protein